MTDPVWLTIARDLVGLREIKGDQHEPEIIALWRDAGLPRIVDDETAWCAGFVGGVLARAKIRPSGSTMARSYMHWGIDCLELGAEQIPLGAIVVYSRPPDPSQGHVGFAVGITAEGNILTLGGNQGDSVAIAPFKAGRLIAARWPVEERADLRLLHRIPFVSTSKPLSTNEA